MPSSGTPADKQARFSVTFLRNLVFYSANRGIDVTELCERAGTSPAVLDAPDDFVDGAIVAQAWEAAIEMTGDEQLGLHMGEAFHPSYLGLLGFAMQTCETAGEAVDLMIRYWNLMGNGSTVSTAREGNQMLVQLQVTELPGNFLCWSRHPAESSLSAFLAIWRALTGRSLPLRDVASTYGKPSRTGEYERIFGRAVRFSAEANLLAFDAEAWDWRVLQANAALRGPLEREINDRLQTQAQSAAGRVRQEIGKRLRGAVPDVGEIAAALGQSVRALQRDLQQEDTTFREVLDGLREDLAREHLKGKDTPIGEVSFVLGFSEPSAFHRSFRKWTGQTPQEFRRAYPG